VEPNPTLRQNYKIFEGTYTLPFTVSNPSPPAWIAQQLQAAAAGSYETCVNYEYKAGNGCGDRVLTTYIKFNLLTSGVLKTDWGWSGIDDQGRCVCTAGTVFGYQTTTQVTNICGGATGLLLSDVRFLTRVSSTGQGAAQASFDIYID
jgi:hypothetical protein